MALPASGRHYPASPPGQNAPLQIAARNANPLNVRRPDLAPGPPEFRPDISPAQAAKPGTPKFP